MSRCPRCPYSHLPDSGGITFPRGTVIRPTGPSPARIMVVSDYGGRLEDLRGETLCGETGQECDGLYWPLMGYDRSELYCTNAIKCIVPDSFVEQALPSLAESCVSHHLHDEIAAVQPSIILCLGGTAARALMPSIIPSPSGYRPWRLDMEHGIPAATIADGPLAQYSIDQGGSLEWVWATYNPANGMRSPVYMRILLEDFSSLSRLLADDWSHLPVDTYAGDEDYRELLGLDDYLAVLPPVDPYTPSPYAGIDTETEGQMPLIPWSLQFSFRPGTGYLIDARNRELLYHLNQDIKRFTPVFHNRPYDWQVAGMLGVTFSSVGIDTQQEAYRLNFSLGGSGGGGGEDDAAGSGGADQGGPREQGLKHLAYRLCGMVMTSFEDLVAPWSVPHVRGYLGYLLASIERPQAPRTCGTCHHAAEAHKGGRGICSLCEDSSCRRYKRAEWIAPDEPTVQASLRRKANRLDGDMAKAIDESEPIPNPWRRYRKWEDEEKGWAEFVVGKSFPQPRIGNVPRDLAIRYACRDSDSTLRLWYAMAEMQRRIEDRV